MSHSSTTYPTEGQRQRAFEIIGSIITEDDLYHISVAKVAASVEVAYLISIIEKLIGKKIQSADEALPDGTDDSGNEYELSSPEIVLSANTSSVVSVTESAPIEPGMLIEHHKDSKLFAGFIPLGDDDPGVEIDPGNEYELLSPEEESLIINGNPNAATPEGLIDASNDPNKEPQPWSENNPVSEEDVVISQLQSRATDLAYSISNPATLSKKLRESLIDIVGPEAAITYHLGATFNSSSKEVKFQIARISPSMAFKLQSDLKTTEVGFSYIKTVNGWRVAVGLTASMESSDSGIGLTRIKGLQAPSGSQTTGSFSVTVSK